MSLEEQKITGYKVSVAALPDKIENKAAWLKSQFDARTDGEVKEKHNGLVEALKAPQAADELGAGIDGLAAGTVAGAVKEVLDKTAAHEADAGNPHGVTAAQTGAYTKEEMLALVGEKLVEIGAGDMAQAVYDPDGDGVVKEALYAQTAGTAQDQDAREGAAQAKAAAALAQETAQAAKSTAEALLDGTAKAAKAAHAQTADSAAAAAKATTATSAANATKANTANYATAGLMAPSAPSVKCLLGVSNNIWGFYPDNDNAQALGFGFKRWAQLYAGTATISTSDRNEKNSIAELEADQAQAFMAALRPVTYKLNDGASGRTHWGLIAQDVEEAMTGCGLTDMDFAGFIRSPRAEEYETGETDAQGEAVKAWREIPDEYLYGLRYEEFVAPLIAAVQAQQKEITGLAARVAQLEKGREGE